MEWHKNTSTILKAVVPIIISLSALYVSFLSYNISRKSLSYQIDRNQLWDTPALVDVSDSTEFKFILNKEEAQLQSITVIFPDEILNNNLELLSKPLAFSTETLELFTKEFLYDYLQLKDSSILVGNFLIPVVIDYSAIVGSQAFLMRENRQLVFDICITSDETSIKYNSSIMLPRPNIDKSKDPDTERKILKKDLSKQLQLSLKNLQKN